MNKNFKVFQKNADKTYVSEIRQYIRKGLNMRIENEMLSRFGNLEHQAVNMNEKSLSSELDFFFDNVLDTVVEYFTDKELVNVR